MNDVARALLAKARESLESAFADLEADRLNGASSRAYYAMFHAARHEGDYDLEAPDRDDVASTVRNAQAFVDAVVALLEREAS